VHKRLREYIGWEIISWSRCSAHLGLAVYGVYSLQTKMNILLERGFKVSTHVTLVCLIYCTGGIGGIGIAHTTNVLHRYCGYELAWFSCFLLGLVFYSALFYCNYIFLLALLLAGDVNGGRLISTLDTEVILGCFCVRLATHLVGSYFGKP